jgi:hypothetical protein
MSAKQEAEAMAVLINLLDLKPWQIDRLGYFFDQEGPRLGLTWILD